METTNKGIVLHPVTFRLDLEQLGILDDFAREQGVNRASVIRIALKRLLESEKPLIA